MVPAIGRPMRRSWSTPIRAACCTTPTPTPAPSRLADQDHDALSAVRADRSRQAAARSRLRSFRPRRAAGALQARPASRARPSRSRTRSARSSPSRPTTPRSWSPKRSAATRTTFARMMTRKARALGMSRTVYINASGLPDEDQLTTARDQAMLGRAIQDRFPRYYRYFATPSFVYRGHAMRNHNKLLGTRRGRRRDQDRLHPRLRLQPGVLGAARQSAHRRGRDGRHLRCRARRAHAQPDRAAYRRSASARRTVAEDHGDGRAGCREGHDHLRRHHWAGSGRSGVAPGRT